MSDKFKTPSLGNTSEKDFDLVYEPAEDSYLLLDALEKEDTFLQNLRLARFCSFFFNKIKIKCNLCMYTCTYH